MEVGDRKILLSPQDLFDASEGARESGDEELYQFLLTRLKAFWQDTDMNSLSPDAEDNGADDPDPATDDDLDDRHYVSTFDKVAEIFGPNVGIIEIPFGKKELVERIAGCICVGKAKGEEVDQIIERITTSQRGIEPELTTSQRLLLERNRQREKFGGRPPYLRPVPNKKS